ncbi:hypothetical protein [Consotaella salsifontis]|uniref:hypothetical protein n=1 Tax=Consotaella salsifontis TaxID=1365950 RepID=UPI001FD987D6|nr:hypothetical protein [Consotaella salsifontis]
MTIQIMSNPDTSSNQNIGAAKTYLMTTDAIVIATSPNSAVPAISEGTRESPAFMKAPPATGGPKARPVFADYFS